MQALADELHTARQKLKPVTNPIPKEHVTTGAELSPEEEQRIREDFFAAGLENWLPLLGDLSFESASIPLSRACCEAILNRDLLGEGRDALENEIDAKMKELRWDRIFVKLSTRSPKDSPLILSEASDKYRQRGGPKIPDLLDRATLLAEAVQESFSVGSGYDAVELLLSSDRVIEDLEYALQAPHFDKLGLHIVIRKWEDPIPIANEFRGIVWDGSMNSLGQYYHPLVFPSAIRQKKQIEEDIRAVHNELQPRLSENGFNNYIIDFAWMAPGEVKIVELNPFDGLALGCFPGSTGLFLWDDDNDHKVIQQGPFEFRLRTTPLPEHELKDRLNRRWKDIIELKDAV